MTGRETVSLYEARVEQESERIRRALRRRWQKFVGKRATFQIQCEMAGDAGKEVLRSIGNVFGPELKKWR